MKKVNRLLRYLLYLCLIGLGIVAGIAIRHYKDVPLEETINLVDLATLVVTIFLAVYIPEVLDRKLQVKRDKKILIGNRIGELQTIMRKINSLVQDDNMMNERNFLTVKNQLDVSANKLDTISTLLRYADFGADFENDIAGIGNMCKEHRTLLLAEYREGNKFLYPEEVQQREETLFNEIDKATSLLLFRISDVE